MIIYCVTNLINGKIYIGQDAKNRPNYFGSGKYVQQAIKKYSIENFRKDILAYCYSKDELDAYEIFWIKKLNSKAPNGYNLTDGGGGFSGKHSKKTKQKMSQSQKGRVVSEETKEKISSYAKINPNYGMRGRCQSEETRQKMRKPKTETHRQNMSKAQKGKKLSEKIKQNISKGMLKYWEGAKVG